MTPLKLVYQALGLAVDVPSTELLTSEASFVTSKPFSESDLKEI